MRRHASMIIVLGAMFSTMAGFGTANAQSMNFKNVDTSVHAPSTRPAPVHRAPAEIRYVEYVVCIDGYERAKVMPYEHGRRYYQACPAPVMVWSDAAIAPEFSPLPRRNPLRARGAGTVRPTHATSPDLSVLTFENSVLGASAAAVTVSVGATAPPRQDRERTARTAATRKASKAAANQVAKKLVFRAIPILGTAVLLYDLAGFVE